MLIVWKGNAPLLILFALLGAVVGVLVSGQVDPDRKYLVSATAAGALIGTWIYMFWLGKSKTYAVQDPNTGRVTHEKRGHSIYFIPVFVWAVFLSFICGTLIFAELKSGSFFTGGVPLEELAETAAKSTGSEAFKAADSLLTTPADEDFHGDGRDAKRLARDFAKRMQAFRKMAVEEKGVIKSTSPDADFLTYCRVTADRKLVFITRVPGLRKFTDEAKTVMGKAGWNIASEIAHTLNPRPEAIAVGIRGITLYSEVLEGPPGGQPKRHEKSSDALHDYFTAVTEERKPEPIAKQEPETTPMEKEMLEWTSSDGRTLEAVFVRFTTADGSEAEFRREDGKVYNIPLSRFDEGTQATLRGMFRDGESNDRTSAN